MANVSFISQNFRTLASNYNQCSKDGRSRQKKRWTCGRGKRTGKWMAGELGKSTCTVSKWCSNVAQPDLQTLDKVAKALEVNVKDLLNDTEK